VFSSSLERDEFVACMLVLKERSMNKNSGRGSKSTNGSNGGETKSGEGYAGLNSGYGGNDYFSRPGEAGYGDDNHLSGDDKGAVFNAIFKSHNMQGQLGNPRHNSIRAGGSSGNIANVQQPGIRVGGSTGIAPLAQDDSAASRVNGGAVGTLDDKHVFDLDDFMAREEDVDVESLAGDVNSERGTTTGIAAPIGSNQRKLPAPISGVTKVYKSTLQHLAY
jgi:hypothetical protein